jgi:hypothetical protein
MAEPTDQFQTAAAPSSPRRPGARERGRMRRRLRRQRQVREALLLDLGALVFELHRHGRREPELLQAKAAELSAVDAEVRALADALEDETSMIELVASGIAGSCESCGSLLSTDARYCAACGTPVVPELGTAAPAPPVAAPGPPAEDTAATSEIPVPGPIAEPEPEPTPEPEAEPAAQDTRDDLELHTSDMPELRTEPPAAAAEPEQRPEPQRQEEPEQPPAQAPTPSPGPGALPPLAEFPAASPPSAVERLLGRLRRRGSDDPPAGE